LEVCPQRLRQSLLDGPAHFGLELEQFIIASQDVRPLFTRRSLFWGVLEKLSDQLDVLGENPGGEDGDSLGDTHWGGVQDCGVLVVW